MAKAKNRANRKRFRLQIQIMEQFGGGYNARQYLRRLQTSDNLSQLKTVAQQIETQFRTRGGGELDLADEDETPTNPTRPAA